MTHKRVFVVLMLVVLSLMLAVSVSQAQEPSYDIVTRVFMDVNNDANVNGDEGDFGLAGWVLELSGVTPKQQAVTGPEGFASFKDLDPTKTYTVRVIANPDGGKPWEDGWRLARGGGGMQNNPTGVYGSSHKRFIVGSAYTIQPEDWRMRVNGDYEAWVRFSVIRVQRVIISGAANGDVFEFFTVRNNGSLYKVDQDTAGPNGFASAVAGGMFYGNTIRVVRNGDFGGAVDVKIPFSWQPHLKVISGVLTCTSHCGF